MRLALAFVLLPALVTAQTIARQLQGYATGDLPAVCPNGRLAYDTTTEQLKECTSNTWTATSGAATDLACTDCVALTTETSGNYAAGDAEAGNATGVACTDCVTLATETDGNYAAGDAEAGNALTGDSATAFFSLGAIEVARGGTGAAPGADDQVLVSDSTSGATWRTLTDCDAAGSAVQYDTGANGWSCNSAIAAATGDSATSFFSSGAVEVGVGGTGSTSFGAAAGALVTSGASGTGALSRVDAVATGRVLVSAGAATNPAWSTSPVLTLVDVPEIANSTQVGGACVGGSVCLDDNVDVNGTLQCDGAFDANSTSDFAADIVLSGTADLSATGTGTSCTAGRVCVNDDAEINGTLTVDTAIDTPKIYTGTATGGACTGAALCLDDNTDTNGTAQFDGALDVNSTSDFAADIVLSGTADISASGTGTSCTAGNVCVNDSLEVNTNLFVDGDLVGGRAYVRKTADESVSSSTSLQADNVLTFSVAASETWEFLFVVRYLGNTTGDFRCGLKFPTTPTAIAYNIEGPALDVATDAQGATSGGQVSYGAATADAVSGLQLGATTAASVARLTGVVVNSTNAGSVTLWWAQGTSNATSTTVMIGSYLIARRIL